MERPVVIVGAGIAGLALAIALRRRGVAARVYERATALRAGGGALLLWSNAVRVLDSLGLGPAVRAAGVEVAHTDFRDYDGALLWRMPVADLGRDHGAPSLVIARTDLLHLLATGLDDVIAFDHSYVGHAPHARGIDVHFEHRPPQCASLVVGADGLYSAVRSELLGVEVVRAVGQVAWVGLVEHAGAWLPSGTSEAIVGDGRRFWAARVKDGRVYWYATVPDLPSKRPRDLLELAGLFVDAPKPIAAVVAATAPADCVRTTVFDRRPVRSWGLGAATLIGDAAHPSTPDLGQGACQGLESALALANAIAAGGAVETSLRRYEQARMERTARVTAMSRATALLGAVEGGTPGRIRDLGIRWLLPRLATERVGWLLRGELDLDRDSRQGDAAAEHTEPPDDTDGLW